VTAWSKSNASNKSSSAGLLVGAYGLFFAIFDSLLLISSAPNPQPQQRNSAQYCLD
jgi:hypothetical protein